MKATPSLLSKSPMNFQKKSISSFYQTHLCVALKQREACLIRYFKQTINRKLMTSTNKLLGYDINLQELLLTKNFNKLQQYQIHPRTQTYTLLEVPL